MAWALRCQALLYVLAYWSLAQPVRGEIAQRDKDLVAEVSQRLLAVVAPERVPENLHWPPPCEVREELKGDRHNAYATLKQDENGKILRDEKTEQFFPLVVILSGYMEDVVAGEADCLALTLAHEMEHLLGGHVTRDRHQKPALVEYAFTRVQEDEADRRGAELLLQAGYSLTKGLVGWRRMESLGKRYSSFEGLRCHHPAALDRIAALDKDRTLLWRAMSAFQNGTDFLLMEQYAAAAACFAAVIKEFPTSHEAWANLGYAQLMQYCDALEAADVRTFGVGQIACQGFYRRPQSLEELTRGIHEELWAAAVMSLRKSLDQEPQRALPKAHLGLAFLVRPTGPDAKQARRYFEEASGLAAKAPELEAGARAALLVNAGVSCLAGGELDRARRLFADAEQALPGEGLARAVRVSLAQTLLYNRAFALAKSTDPAQRGEAVKKLEEYLGRAGAAGVWRTLALERYTELCQGLKLSPKGERELAPKTAAALRQLVSLELPEGKMLVLGQPIEEARGQLGSVVESPLATGGRLIQLSCSQHGLQLIAADNLVAIRLQGAAAPPVVVQQTGVASRRAEIRIGLSRQDLDRILADQDYDFRRITDQQVDYRFYPNLGLAVRVRQGAVSEIVLAQIPREEYQSAFR
jgi:tetratricopeptide (TPR) repeat protein